MARKVDAVAALQAEVERLRSRSEELQAEFYDLDSAHRVVLGEDEVYCALVRRAREAVRALVPSDSTILVISKGDPALLDLYGRPAWHFPRAADGRYAGHYPKRGISAVAHLEALRARGADYLLIPETARWWLDHYSDFHRHLEQRYRRLDEAPGSHTLYSLREPACPEQRVPAGQLLQLLDDHAPTLGEDPSILDWTSEFDLVTALPRHTVFTPLTDSPSLPYLDESVDVVVIRSSDPDIVREASRVAAKVVVNFAGRPAGRKLTTRLISCKQTPPSAAVPSVSIVIPCHDGLRLTAACVTSLLETLPVWFRGEIIVVDDASADGTAERVAEICRSDRRVRSLRNDPNRGFLASCNRGARAAKSDFLLFLNNDTVLLPGWLAPLLRTFVDFPDAGVVGGKLLFEDGTLQEAGGLVFADASAAKIGYLDADAEAPLYNSVRDVDYVSAAFLMTPRRLFLELGGLDARYGFGYYDDDDYCFAVREAGLRVYYQPESALVHVEGGSAGTDLSSGLKQNQVTNQAIFAQKWQKALERQPARPEPLDWYALRRLETARQPAGGNGR